MWVAYSGLCLRAKPASGGSFSWFWRSLCIESRVILRVARCRIRCMAGFGFGHYALDAQNYQDEMAHRSTPSEFEFTGYVSRLG